MGELGAVHWTPYINSLPTEYSLPLLYTQAEVDSLPSYISSAVVKQKEVVDETYNRLTKYFPRLDRKRFLWGFCTVNTRAVYLMKDPRDPGEGENDGDCLALVPFLDLLNHSDEVTVEAGINLEQTSNDGFFYQLKVGQDVRRYEEAFICYGKHSNTKLLTEYGFSLGPENKSEHIPISISDVLTFFQTKKINVIKLNAKLSLLKENKLSVNLGLSTSGLNWTLKAVIFILLLDADNLKAWHCVYQHEDFEHLNVVFADFLEYVRTYIEKCATKMCGIENPSKYFFLAKSVVNLHIEMIDKARTII